MLTDIKLSKAQINNLIKSGGALGSVLARFLPKFRKLAISLGKNILASLGLGAAMSATDAAIQINRLKIGFLVLYFKTIHLSIVLKYKTRKPIF